MNVVALLLLCSTTTPTEAANWAISDAPTEETRYIWLPEHMATSTYNITQVGSAINWMMNAVVSKASTIVTPRRIANGHMLVYDFRVLVPNKKEREKVLKLWDDLALDEPYFHLTANNSPDPTKVFYAPHLELEKASLTPVIYRGDWLLDKVLREKYYEFMLFLGDDGKLLTLDQVAERYGVNFKKSIENDADSRVLIAVSGVSESARRIDRYQGFGGRQNTGVFFTTWDTKKGNAQIEKDPFYNIRKFFPDGGEAIWELSNGFHGFVIYDGKRNLVRAGDTELVNDYLVPGAHNKAIVPGISCIRCHGPHQGLWPCPNHIKQLHETQELEIIGDLTDLSEEENERLAGQYLGDFKPRIDLARIHYTEATRRATRAKNLEKGLDVVEVSALISSLYNNYNYEKVTPESACKQLGLDPGDDAAATLQVAVPKAEFRNVKMALLRANIPIRTEEWEEIYASARLLTIKGAKK